MLIENRDVNVEMRTVLAWGRFMPDTPNTRLRRIIEKADRRDQFWRRLESGSVMAATFAAYSSSRRRYPKRPISAMAMFRQSPIA
jgi:hypothetical protein